MEADEDPGEPEQPGSCRSFPPVVPGPSGSAHQICARWGVRITALVMAGFMAMRFKQRGSTQAIGSLSWAQFWVQDPAAYKNSIIEVLKFQGEHACRPQLANTAFQSNISWKDAAGMQSGAHCQQACTWNRGCDGFTWHFEWGCDLMQFPDARTTKVATRYEQGRYSGYACRREASPIPWIYDELQKHTLPSPEHSHPAPEASMLCLMVVRPYTYEIDLAIMQHKLGTGIFQCKHHAIYSNELIVLADGLSTRKFNSSQYAEIGGQWMTALNTDIFMAFWRAVITDGDYLKTGWTVKVDPDTVWFPQRLRPILREQEKAHNTRGAGAYFQNCWQGMHGPIEVFSQHALRALALHSAQCFWVMNNWGNWQWGEDMWIDVCLKDTAASHRIYNTQLLAEDHCNKWEGWSLTPDACLDEDKVAFHPFKDMKNYKHCLDTAQKLNHENSFVMK
eukprot:TRINITY_DN15617_c0_g2_i1.p1 TRINITY_DN15617_c0_g2~~TRINITY_DN15617_c0_g2_i1.p1  ORF type:complete len:490 (-),score=64.08 TRINITY_DN15617_c0_g2_i1:147-1493(-)